VGEIRLGPSGLPDAPSFEEAAATLAARGYRACEIGFAGGFWLDYDAAPALHAALAAEDIVLSIHAPLAAFMGHVEREKKFKMALGMLDHTAGLAKACGAEVIVFHPGFLLSREREQVTRGDRHQHERGQREQIAGDALAYLRPRDHESFSTRDHYRRLEVVLVIERLTVRERTLPAASALDGPYLPWRRGRTPPASTRRRGQ